MKIQLKGTIPRTKIRFFGFLCEKLYRMAITMKIKTKQVPYEYAVSVEKPKHIRPKKPSLLFRSLVRIAASFDLHAVKFQYTESRMDEAGEGPYLVLMNHSSFVDLEIASKLLYPKPYCIVTTCDGFVGKEGFMRKIGCFPTQKFVPDITLITDMRHALQKEKTSVLMYPEASYTFDGCATPLPRKLGVLLKKLDVPVLMIRTDGAFLRDPLYNCLQKRNVKVSAHISCLFTQAEIREKSVQELDKVLDDTFTFDNFARQYETKTVVDEPFRADGLERILYRCAHCHAEGETEGKGTTLVCHHCGKTYEMDVYGRLQATDGETEFPHIPDWYRWERDCVRQELENGTYLLDTAVDIAVLSDYQALYQVGEGRLVHNTDGFLLTGCDGKLEYKHSPLASYGLYADYYWYELGDMICIGNKAQQYYCFPKGNVPVAKARLAAEELYKLKKQEKKK